MSVTLSPGVPQADAWRVQAGADNPAGPLFTTSYAEHEFVELDSLSTQLSICTGSGTIQCC